MKPKTLGVSVFIVALAIGITAAYAISLLATPKPRIALVDIRTDDAKGECGLFQTTQRVGAEFTVLNTGPIDGFAVVQLRGGGRALAENTYFVRSGISIERSLDASVDCREKFSVIVQITEVRSP